MRLTQEADAGVGDSGHALHPLRDGAGQSVAGQSDPVMSKRQEAYSLTSDL
ncbi:hypothetical protein AB0N62_39500 [Streptomyces sp. NPDC093982]|uniref:hypothetical protein n=1 Tax=Streptomyces sp. NPDC093982 TaxID=3155077 RepID=UPI003425FFDC